MNQATCFLIEYIEKTFFWSSELFLEIVTALHTFLSHQKAF